MPSPRASPAIRPSSPLSSRFDSSTRNDFLQPPSPRSPRAHTRTSTQQRRSQAATLRLPPLPRFHPANFPSRDSSMANTPATGPMSPQSPRSPGSQQRLYSDAQRQLYLHQREILAGRATQTSRVKPTSPRLEPAGSPGPVTTPFELEELEGGGGYLAAGARAANRRAIDEHTSELSRRLAQQTTYLEPSPQISSDPGRTN